MLCRVLRRFDLDLGTPGKTEQFYRSLRELVTILFAVVLGLGLEELDDLDETQWKTDLLFLATGYFAVVLSWWFYHRGTIVGPPERNILSYAIDCLLIVDYWFLINRRANPAHLLAAYTTMFLLYWLWETVRICQNFPPPHGDRVKRASAVNLFFFALSLFLTSWCFADLWPFHYSQEMDRIICLISIALLVLVYRLPISRIYSKVEVAPPKTIGGPGSMKQTDNVDEIDMKLSERAKSIAANARVHLSGFRVGAAILSESGKIYVGCNAEFDNYSNTIHAEEAALSALVTAGDSKPVKIAVFTDTDAPCFPCGMCRQSLYELGGPDLEVLACNNHEIRKANIQGLLPSAFHL